MHSLFWLKESSARATRPAYHPPWLSTGPRCRLQAGRGRLEVATRIDAPRRPFAAAHAAWLRARGLAATHAAGARVRQVAAAYTAERTEGVRTGTLAVRVFGPQARRIRRLHWTGRAWRRRRQGG